MNGMELLFKQANFADNKKVRYAKLKLIGKAQRFWENLEYFRYMNYEPAISVWEDMKEKFVMSICHRTIKLSIYHNLIVVLFKLKQIR